VKVSPASTVRNSGIRYRLVSRLVCCQRRRNRAGSRTAVVSFVSTARPKQIALPVAAARLRLGEAAKASAARIHITARLSRNTIRWNTIARGLRPKSRTAPAAARRCMPRRRASRYIMAALMTLAQIITSRPADTAVCRRSNSLVSQL